MSSVCVLREADNLWYPLLSCYRPGEAETQSDHRLSIRAPQRDEIQWNPQSLNPSTSEGLTQYNLQSLHHSTIGGCNKT